MKRDWPASDAVGGRRPGVVLVWAMLPLCLCLALCDLWFRGLSPSVPCFLFLFSLVFSLVCMFFSFSQFVVLFSVLHVRLCSFCSLSSSSGFPPLVFPSVPSLSPVCVLWFSFVPLSLYWLLSSPLLFWFFSPIRPQFFMGSPPLSTVFSCFRPPSFRLSAFFLFRPLFVPQDNGARSLLSLRRVRTVGIDIVASGEGVVEDNG